MFKTIADETGENILTKAKAIVIGIIEDPFDALRWVKNVWLLLIKMVHTYFPLRCGL